MSEPRKYQHLPLSAETIKRDLKEGRAHVERVYAEFEQKFEPALREAYSGNTRPLHDLLRSLGNFAVENQCGVSLSGVDLWKLADLILRRGRQGRRGRAGVVAVSDVEIAQQRIITLAAKRLAGLRKQSGGKVPTDGNYKRAVTRAIDCLIFSEELDETAKKDLDFDYIYNALKRGKRKPTKSLSPA